MTAYTPHARRVAPARRIADEDGSPARGILLAVAISVAGFWAPLAVLLARLR